MKSIKSIISIIKRLQKVKNFKEIISVLICSLAIAILVNPKAFNLNTYAIGELLNKTIIGKVVNISDGDTITLLDKNNQQYKIRLYGIDAPESKQAYGQQAKHFLSSLIANKEVKVLVLDKDKYQRMVAKVFLEDLDINKEMVKNGYAHAYTEFSKEYKPQELKARKAKLGLWRDENPIKPSDFRKNQKGIKDGQRISNL